MSRRAEAARLTQASLWPDGLGGRVILVLLGAMVLEYFGSTVLYEKAAFFLPNRTLVEELAERVSVAERVLSALPPNERPRAADALTADGLRVGWDPAAAASQDDRTPLPLATLRARLLASEPRLGVHALRLHTGSKDGFGVSRDVLGTLRLDDGSTLRFGADQVMDAPPGVYDALFSTALFAGGVLLAAGMVVRTLGAPLRALAGVADAIGHGPPVAVAERGPREVRQVSRAFNAMQDRIARLIADRTEALAAVSHDLRTPIARLRLRAGFLDDAEMAAAMEADLEEMEHMVASVLAFLGGEVDPEPPRQIDLVAVLTTLVDAAADAGRDASYAGPDHATLRARPLEIKRAFGNLIDNALKYGGCVRVSLDVPPDGAVVRVRVEDRGPGIPPDELDRVLAPFHRVEASRNANTGGIGLGLAIVRRAVERDGGRIVLHNRPEGGLCAEVVLPA